jgi:hypothetical protein
VNSVPDLPHDGGAMKSNARFMVALHLGAVALLLLSMAFPPASDERRARETASAVRELVEGNERFAAGSVHAALAGLSTPDLSSSVRYVAVSIAPPEGSPAPSVLFDLPRNRVYTIVAGSDPAGSQAVAEEAERLLTSGKPLLIVVMQYGTRATADLSDGICHAIEGSPLIASAVHRSAVRIAIAVVDPGTWRANIR